MKQKLHEAICFLFQSKNVISESLRISALVIIWQWIRRPTRTQIKSACRETIHSISRDTICICKGKHLFVCHRNKKKVYLLKAFKYREHAYSCIRVFTIVVINKCIHMDKRICKNYMVLKQPFLFNAHQRSLEKRENTAF